MREHPGAMPSPDLPGAEMRQPTTGGKILPLLSWRSAVTESDLPSSVRLVALTLSLHMGDKGERAFPGAGTLARETGLHISTVKRSLRHLEATGWLVCVERGGLRGESRRANDYRAEIPVAVSDRLQEETGSTGRANRYQETREPVAQDDPNSSGNSSTNSGGARTRGTRVPDPFEVSPHLIAWAEKNVPTVNWRWETGKMLDHYRAAPGRAGLRVDWDAVWRKWMRTVAEKGLSSWRAA